MTEHQSSRTLVKSAPELWAECSDAASLARHLGAFGEIRITKLEPETAVAWEGAAASGTVRLESSGWGTRVILTVTEEAPPAQPEPVAAEPVAVEPAAEASESEPEPVAEPEPEPVAEPEPEPVAEEPVAEEPREIVGSVHELMAEPELVAPRRGMFARLRMFRRRPEPEPVSEVAAEPESELVQEAEPVVVAAPEPEPEPVAEIPPDPEPVAEATPQPEPEAEPAPPRPSGEDALNAALESLGMAHHRPYSRA
jgi:hypothetical protein